MRNTESKLVAVPMILGCMLFCSSCGQPRKSTSKINNSAPASSYRFAFGQVVPPADCNTVDPDKDDGTLTCVKVSLQTSGAAWSNLPVDPSVTKLDRAFAYLAGCNKSTAMIIGHAQPGQIHVGGGGFGSTLDTDYIADLGKDYDPPLWNVDLWTDRLDHYNLSKKFATVTLLGCDAASRSTGEELVKEFSKHVNGLVRAPTSIVWCDLQNHQLRLQDGSGWISAQNGKIVEKPLTPPHPAGLQENVDTAKFQIDKSNRFSFLSDFHAIRLCVLATPYHPAQSCRVLHNRESLLSSVYWADAFQPNALPNSEITGTIELFPGEATEKCERSRGCFHLDILNDNLLADFDTTTYYYVKDKFFQSWTSFE